MQLIAVRDYDALGGNVLVKCEVSCAVRRVCEMERGFDALDDELSGDILCQFSSFDDQLRIAILDIAGRDTVYFGIEYPFRSRSGPIR